MKNLRMISKLILAVLAASAVMPVFAKPKCKPRRRAAVHQNPCEELTRLTSTSAGRTQEEHDRVLEFTCRCMERAVTSEEKEACDFWTGFFSAVGEAIRS